MYLLFFPKIFLMKIVLTRERSNTKIELIKNIVIELDLYVMLNLKTRTLINQIKIPCVKKIPKLLDASMLNRFIFLFSIFVNQIIKKIDKIDFCIIIKSQFLKLIRLNEFKFSTLPIKICNATTTEAISSK